MKIYISEELVDKYLKGECTSEEEELILAWYESFDDDFSEPISTSEWVEIQSAMFSRINENKEIIESRDLLSKKLKRRRLTMFYILTAASCIFLFLYSMLIPSVKQEVQWPYQRMVNNSNKIKKEVLQDHSVIWLQPRSLIVVDKDFNKINRRIWLQGEAFFEVEHNDKVPFIVISGYTKTKVLGTSFNVKTGLTGDKTEVVVATGRVKVDVQMHGKTKVNRTVILFPKDKVIYLDNNSVLSKSVDRNNVTGIYRKVNLHFEDNKVSEIIERLNALYGSNIYAEEIEISNYLLTADFNNMNLPDVLDVLEKSLLIQYEKTERGIKLTNKQTKDH